MRRFLLPALLLLVGGAAPLAAQLASFGQNKIQYRRFDWQVIHGPHVDLYFYPAEAHLASTALTYAEASYDTLALQFGHEVTTRIPLIVYASHTDFEQTNVLPFVPPEGLLGATDFLKRRVTLPFGGNFAEFRHTLRHEMVHVFQLSIATRNYYKNARAGQIHIPLWWSEGLAELWSGGQEPTDEMIMRDITFSGQLPGLKEMEYVSGGIVYPIGGRIHRWLADTYGDWRVAVFYENYWRYESFDEAMRAVYGRSIEQLGEEFKLAMRREYYPTAQDRGPLSVVARQLARGAIKPAFGVTRDSTPEAFYISGARGYITVRRRPLDGGKSRDVAQAGKSADLENLHPFDSRLDPSRSPYVLFSARTGDRDALFVWNVERRKLEGRYQFPGLVSILSPVWGPEGKSVLFSGLAESGVSDLYRVYLPGGKLEKLTDDRYQDLDPSVSPDGDQIVFASDRTAGGLGGAINLFLLDLQTHRIRQLTVGPWQDLTPRWAQDGRIYFTSSRDGVLNVFSLDSLGTGRRETSAWTGAFDPAYIPDRKALLVSGFSNLNWGIYLYPRDSAAQSDTFGLAEGAPHSEWRWPVADSAQAAIAKRQPYQRKLTLDFAAGEAAVIPGYGGLQGAQAFLSDLLGDHFVYLGIASYQGRNLGNILENLNATAIYLNQSRRLNWGVGVYRTNLASYSGPFDISYREKAYGALGLIRYPLDRYNRIEAETVVEHSDRVDFEFPDGAPVPADGLQRVGWINSNYLSYITDNSLWLYSGPIDGRRFRLTLGAGSDLSHARFDNYLVNVDARRYFRLANRVAYAVRLFGWYSGGALPRRVNLGGSLAMRGYPLYGTIVGSRAYMVNQELRFPLLNYLTLGTPAGPLTLPELQGAAFVDVGKAWYLDQSSRALIGSYGISFRWALAPFLVLRLDWGRRFSDGDFRGYPLTPDEKRPGFVKFFFGYNY